MANILVVLSALLTVASGSINYYNIDTNQERVDMSPAFQSPQPGRISCIVKDIGLTKDEKATFLKLLDKLSLQLASNKELCVVPEPQPAANKTKNSPWDKYADIKSCEGRPHTLWVYRTKDPAPVCGVVIKPGLTAMEKRSILDVHNQLRQKVASGKETRGMPGPQPPAQNMKTMEWDDELADMAQRWANQCNFAFDQCRDVERFGVDQLIRYFEYNTKAAQIKHTVEDLVKSWYDNIDEIDGRDISKLKFTIRQRTYAQLVAADTYKLGCGSIIYPVSAGKRFYLVCNYGPSYNESQPMYKIF